MLNSQTRTNPYIGPRPFQAGETLYGRDREVRELCGLLIAERIVLLHSPSGAGKTSLIQAALVPRMRARDFAVRPAMRLGSEPPVATPNRYTLSALLALEEGLPPSEQLPLDQLATLTLDEYLRRRPVSAEADGELLIVDQFEELLTSDPGDEAGRLAFVAQLSAALLDRQRWALLAIREDYLGALEPYVRPVPTRLNVSYRLGLLGVEGARRAIQGPARAAGVNFSDEAATRLANDLAQTVTQSRNGQAAPRGGASVEPVQLQVVCRRLWQRHFVADGSPGNTISDEDVAGIGDVDQALGDYYAAGVASAASTDGTSERAIRSWFERQLLTPQGLRGQVLQGADEQAPPEAAIAALIDTYLVRAEPRRGAVWLELAHDRLIAPVRASNAAWFAANLSALQRQAELWQRQGRPASLLLRGETLDEAEAWAATRVDELTTVERDLLALSKEARANAEREQRQARRIRALAVVASLVSVIALAALAGALVLYRQSEQRGRLARARELAAAALSNLSSDPQRSVIVAQAGVAATRASGEAVVPEAYQALQQAVASTRVRQIIALGERGLQDVALSPDGTTLAVSANDGTVYLLNAASGEIEQRLRGDENGANGLSWSPDGVLLAAGSGSRALVWNTTTGDELLALQGHTDEVLDVAWSPDGITLASASRDGTARLWDALSGTAGLALQPDDGIVNAVAWSPDGSQLATSSDTAATLWDATSGDAMSRLEGHGDAVIDVAWSPDGSLIATSSLDLSARLWDATSGEQLELFKGHSSSLNGLAFSADGATLATTSIDGTARLWGVASGLLLLSLSGHTDSVAAASFAPDGSTLYTASLDASVRRWNLGLAPPDGAYAAVWSPDGARLATAGASGARVWDAASYAQLTEVLGESEIAALAYSPNGTQLALGNIDGVITLHDAASGDELLQLQGHEPGVSITNLRFSPDGASLASASDDATVRVWDTATGAEQLAFAAHSAEVYGLAWSPNGTLLASGDQAGVVKVWQAATGAEQQSLVVDAGQLVAALAWSPDGRTLAAAANNGVLVLWNTATWSETQRAQTDAPLNNLAYSPDGTRLASANRNALVELLDATSLAPVLRLPHPNEVYTLAWSPDGRQLATAAADGQARILPVALDDLLALAAQRSVRAPSPAECAQYQLSEGCAAEP